MLQPSLEHRRQKIPILLRTLLTKRKINPLAFLSIFVKNVYEGK